MAKRLAEQTDLTVDAARAAGKRRFSQLPAPVNPDEWVESVPQPPPAERGFDPAADAVRRFGIPL